MKLSIQVASTSQTVNVFIQDSSSTSGAGLTGLAYTGAGLTPTVYYALPRAAAVAVTLATQTVTGAYSSGGFIEISSANMPGWYRFDIPDAALASGRFVSIHMKGATNMAPLPIEIELTAWNNQDAVHGGLTCLPNTACTTNSSLLTSGTGTDQLSVASGRTDMGKILGTAVSTPATAGVLDINVKNMNNVAATSITTINAHQGTTSAVAFTNTGTFPSVRSDAWYVSNTSQTGRDLGSDTLAIKTQTDKLTFTVANQIDANVLDWKSATAPAMTGDAYARIGAAGGGLTALGDTRIAFLDVAVSSRLAPLGSVTLNSLQVSYLETGTAQAGAASTITLRSAGSATDNFYRGLEVQIYSGTGAGQARVITAYVGSTNVATVDEAWITNPDNTSGYRLMHRSPKLDSSQRTTDVEIGVAGAGLTALGDTRIANLDATVSSRLAPAGTLATVTNLTNAPGAGDFTAAMKTSLNAATPASVVGAVGSVTGAVGSVTGNVGGNVVGSVGSVTGAVGSVTGSVGSVTGAVGSVTGAVGSVTADVSITQAAADKVFGASGAALAELAQAQPSATPSAASALMLIYMALRNNLTTTASTKSIFNNAGTVIAKKALADDGTTYTETKMVTGP